MATVQRFEDLKVWQNARILSAEIYKLLKRDTFKYEYRLIDQIKGSVGSIMDNIAEGFDRNSRLEFLNSLSIAKGEAGELKSQLYRCFDAGLIDNKEFETLYDKVDEITKLLTSLINYLNRSKIRGIKFKNRVDD